MSYSGGFGHAPRHSTPRYNTPRHNAPRQNAPRHNEGSSRRSHTNMERAMIRYEDPRGGEPSERGESRYDPREDYDPRENYAHTERRRTHGYDRMQENRARGFPNEEYDPEDEPEFAGPSRGSGRQPARSGNARGFPNERYDRENWPEVVGGPNDSLGCRLIRSRNGSQPRVACYAQPDNEPSNHDYGSPNREQSMTGFNGGGTLSPQSRRTSRNATRSHHGRGRGSHDLAGTDRAEWWAEYDRLHMRPTPNHRLIGYMTGPDEQDGFAFVTNPYLTGQMAAIATRVAAQNACF